jgi:hypothetical protein
MHLDEFADPKDYWVTIDDAGDFLHQLERNWPANDVAFILGSKRPATSQDPPGRARGLGTQGVRNTDSLPIPIPNSLNVLPR